MLLRSGRFGFLLALLILTLLWKARNGIPLPFLSPNYTVCTVDIANARAPSHSTSSVTSSAFPDSTGTTNASSATTTSTKQLVATELPVLSKPSSYGYIFYATADDYACSALINIKRLRELFHTRHQIYVLAATTVSVGYIDAFRSLNAVVTIRDPPPLAANSSLYYQGFLLKLESFRMHHVDSSLRRVMVLDSDQLILRSLDSLFELPEVDVAAPRAYWIHKASIASTLLLVTLSDRLWSKINEGIQTIGQGVYDMDLVNRLLGETVLMLPGTYITLNSHFADWNLPNWYRPEARFRKDDLFAEKTGSDLADLWHAINVLLSVKYEPQTTHMSPNQHMQKRQLEIPATAVPIEDATSVPTSSSGSTVDKAGHTVTNESEILTIQDVKDSKIAAAETTSIVGTEEVVHSSPTVEIAAAGQISYPPLVLASSPIAEIPHPNTNEPDTTNSMNTGIKAPHEHLGDSPMAPPEAEQIIVPPHVEEENPPPYPYDPENHPLRGDLFDLYGTAYVLHYTAIDKPWRHPLRLIRTMKPEAHPVLYDSFETWRREAKSVCPKIKVDVPPFEEDGEEFEGGEVWVDIVDII